MEVVSGTITKFDERGITIFVPLSAINVDRAVLRRYKNVLVGFTDGRTISAEQRKKAHALIQEIADWMGDVADYIKRLMKLEFIANRLSDLNKVLFSLSNCDVTTAREFITYLVDFVIRFEVPTKVPLVELSDDIEKYVYMTLLHKQCAVCGKRGELHHDPPLSMGADRTETPQLGWGAICLCRTHHNQAHTQGKQFLEDMHLIPVPLDKTLMKAHKFSKKAQREKH